MVKRLGFFFLLLLFFVLALTVVRAAFYIKYLDIFTGLSFFTILTAFLKGLRFDFSTAAIMLAPFMLLLFFPGVFRKQRVLKLFLYLMLAWEICLIVYDYADILYYAFSQRHLTFEIGNVTGDFGVILQIGLQRNTLELFMLFLFLAVYSYSFLRFVGWFLGKPERKVTLRGKGEVLMEPVALFLIIALSVVFIRGGLQGKPLGVRNAFQDEKVELGILSLNGIYTTFDTIYRHFKEEDPFPSLSTIEIPEERREEFFAGFIDNEKETIHPGYPLYRRFNYESSERVKFNVVIFVMESWSAKFSRLLGGPIAALPNFDRLAREGFLATNAFANAQRSIEALAAILGSLPVWKGMVLGQGGLLYQTRFEPIGSVFSKLGYETIFIHGARTGSMGFDGLVKRLGLSRHISRADFELTPENNDRVWGIYDEFTFERVHEEFLKSEKPFLAVVVSLTSHSPYTFPDRDFERFSESLPFSAFLNSLKYSDWALGKFFETARGADYFDKTLFIIVGDHTEGPSTSRSLYESYRVPLLFYAPGLIEPGEITSPVSQLDILPSIMDALKISLPFTSWGKSLFSPGKREILLPRGNLFVFQSGDYMLLSDLERTLALYSIREDRNKNLADSRKEEAERLLVAMQTYIKFSSELIVGNRVSPPQ